MYHFTLLLNLQLLQSDPWYCTIVRPYVISRFSPPPMVRWGTNLVKYKIIHNNQFYGTMFEWYLYHVGTVPGQHSHHPLPSYNHVLQQPDHSRLGMLWWGPPIYGSRDHSPVTLWVSRGPCSSDSLISWRVPGPHTHLKCEFSSLRNGCV